LWTPSHWHGVTTARTRSPLMAVRDAEPSRLDLIGARILFLNWRCPRHPLAGGAEHYCWNIATRFAGAGAEVTLVTARPAGLARDERWAGVRIRRRGGTYTVYLWAALYLLFHGGDFSAVIDCQNGIPFFAPLFLLARRVTVVLVVHHVHQDQFALRFHRPLSTLGRVLEGPVSRRVYSGRPIVSVSPGTRAEVRRRLRLNGPIYIVPNGCQKAGSHPLRERSWSPSVIYVGRLVAHKRLAILLQATAALRDRWSGLEVQVVGTGPDRGQLEQLSKRIGLERVVTFVGRVPDEERARLLARSWLLVTPSATEGWGLTVIEANAVGRPALAFRVPGLVDSIADGVNGWLLDDPAELATALDARLRQLADHRVASHVAVRCRQWAAHFTWDRSAERMADVVLSAGPVPAEGRRALPHGRTSDVATVVVLENAGGLERLRPRLLPSDFWEIRGNTLRVLLQGHDETTAIAALEDLGLSGRAQVRVARTADLLLGLR
jgi:glycosyltransferase involved in cell wall biosynthesis